jgi:hypothetical protein
MKNWLEQWRAPSQHVAWDHEAPAVANRRCETFKESFHAMANTDRY